MLRSLVGSEMCIRDSSRRVWAIPAEQDTDWVMSSASSSSDNEDTTGHPTRASTRSSTRRTLQSSSPLTGAEPDDDTTSGGVALLASPQAEEQCLHHHCMQRSVAQRLASSRRPSHLPCPSHSRFLGPTRWVETVRSIHGTHLPSSYSPDLETSDPHILSESERSIRSGSPLPDDI